MKIIYLDKIASRGYAVGKAYVFRKQELTADQSHISPEQTDQEILRYDRAVNEVKSQLEESAAGSEIFRAHLAVLNDIALQESVISKIRTKLANAELALEKTKREFNAVLDNMEDEYMRERSGDVKDICNRILRALKGINQASFRGLKEKVIVIAEDLFPSDIAAFPPEYVLGFVTEHGGITSHVSIMARNRELPATVGVKNLMLNVADGDYLILDCLNGSLFINPEDSVICEYQTLKDNFDRNKKKLEIQSTLPAATPDGRTVKICANAGSLEEIRKAVAYNIDGIGLFRTEFQYMQSPHFPTEEALYAVYKEAAVLCRKKLIIRTLDIGGDKTLPYYSIGNEENPFLGWRGIRVSLGMKEVFKTQLRAILRASALGNIDIMYPMIASMEEINEANSLLYNQKAEN